MAWKPTPKPTPTWSNPTSKRPPASTSAGGRTGAAPAGPLAHPPARPPTLLPRRHLAPPRGIVPGSSSWTRRLAHRSERITWDAPPRDIVLGVLSCIVAPNTSLRTRRSGHAARATPSRKLLLTVPLPNLPAAIPAAAHRLLERREFDVAAIAAHRHPRRAPRRRGIKAVSVCLGLPAWGARVERLY